MFCKLRPQAPRAKPTRPQRVPAVFRPLKKPELCTPLLSTLGSLRAWAPWSSRPERKSEEGTTGVSPSPHIRALHGHQQGRVNSLKVTSQDQVHVHRPTRLQRRQGQWGPWIDLSASVLSWTPENPPKYETLLGWDRQAREFG